ncbi:hypothetical protein [Neorhizobium sp. NCHU2750]|uniref:hypothetical protein n=1 Tax=Neorhizobium sp. NCHU2750 TaxID=1825976 RepID=UPI000E71B2EC|nr:hypothetical protein NCHU2750_22780 [Neorhizobium sp. NCHU2750]
MRRSKPWYLVATFALCLGLSACNTTDALTPQVDVGGGSYPSSSPVTQDDTARMAARSEDIETVQSAPLAAPGGSPTETSGFQGPSGLPTQSGPSGSSGMSVQSAMSAPSGAPDNNGQPGASDTLGGQAQALADGASVSPASSGPPPQWQGNDPGGRQVQDDQQAPDGQQAGQMPGSSPPPSGQQAANGAQTIRFLPIIGAPVQAVTPLSRQLAASARAAGLTIRPSGDATADQILKGYFSAKLDGDKVTMAYVWDVLDNAGGRLNRFQGQETMPSAGSDPWDAVSPELMQSIAKKTITEYANWRRGH